MVHRVGTLLRNPELDEIIRLMFWPYRIRCVSGKWMSRGQWDSRIGCMIVDWFQCTSSERRAVLAWEQQSSLMLIDISGILSLSFRTNRRIFKPPFYWDGLVDEVVRHIGVVDHQKRVVQQIL